MLANRSFFSFLELTDPARHHEFNEYHQLDHRPENLALPGVVWGDRWVRSPDCAAMSSGSHPDLARIHYVAMYWFAEPLEASVAAWQELGEMALDWGRRPDLDWTRRDVGFFRPLKGYVNPRVLVSPDALPFRPIRGLHLTVQRVEDPRSSAAERAFAWLDRVHLPDLVDCPGVAGAWTFTSQWCTLEGEGRPATRGLRVQLLFLDEDPTEVLPGIDARRPAWERGGRLHDLDGVLDELLATPLRPITPWQWGWFDR